MAALMNEPKTPVQSSKTNKKNSVLPRKFTFLLGFQSKHFAHSPPISRKNYLLIGIFFLSGKYCNFGVSTVASNVLLFRNCTAVPAVFG